MAGREVQWERLRRYLHTKYVTTGKDSVIDLKYLKIKHRGGGDFFYSYRHRQFIRTGIFSLKLPFLARCTGILSNVLSKISPLRLRNYIPRQPRMKNDQVMLPSRSIFSDRPDLEKFQRPLPSNRISLYLRPALLVLFCVVLVSSLYYTFRSPDFMDELKEIDAVGGFGETQIKNVTSRADFKSHERSEKDERTKDSLLGIPNVATGTPDKKTESSEKNAYKVQPGDTLSEISQKFNISVESIAGSSGIRSPDTISVGQTLKIPPKNGFYYKVKKNDRLGVILGKYKLDLDKILAENKHINPDLLEAGEEIFLLGAKPRNLIYGWLVPVTNRIITSGYGWRTWPRRAFHKGIDLKAYYTRVRAAKSGRVHFVGRLGGYGKVVVLQHTSGYRTLYAHLSKIYVRSGSRVAQGTALGKSGNTGYSFGPHLHFEVSKNGRNINPRGILRGLKRRRRRRR